jgi:hypothetical protein
MILQPTIGDKNIQLLLIITPIMKKIMHFIVIFLLVKYVEMALRVT